MRLRNNSYLYCILMFPFIIVLWILIMLNILKSNVYLISNIILSFVYIYFLVICLFCTVSDIMNSNHKWHLVLLIFFPFIYLPIFYGKEVSLKDLSMCKIVSVINIILLILFSGVFNKHYYNYLVNGYSSMIKIDDNYTHADKRNLFTIDVDKNFVCNNDLGEYDLTCEDNNNDSFIGVYLYERDNYSKSDLKDILDFHLEQTLSYIKENNYEYRLQNGKYTVIKYDDMTIYLKGNVYQDEETVYYLIIVKETKTYQDNQKDFDKLISSIKFIDGGSYE